MIVRRTATRFLTPGWVGFTLFGWAAAVTMVLLGRWQLRVSNSKHFDLQNFGYTLQWWAFSLFAVLIWAKSVRDTVRGRAAGASTGGALVLHGGQSAAVVHVGPAELMTQPDEPGAVPVVYRGYLTPQSSTSPARSDGDPVREAYNDYLWQLALADSATPTVRTETPPTNPRAEERRPAATPELPEA